jgi:hypothetical protein
MSTVISSVNELIQPSIGFVVNIWNAGIGFIDGSADALSSVFLSS